jgi:DNA-binding IclR family transcriptional regulator
VTILGGGPVVSADRHPNANDSSRPSKAPRATAGSVTLEPTYPIESVDRALRLIAALRDQGPLRLSTASDLLGCGRSTAHRLLAMLTYHGFADQDVETRIYRAGRVLLDHDRPPFDALLVEVARPVLKVVASGTGETAHLTLLQGNSAVFLETVESTNEVRTRSRRGVSYPAHCTSGGKVLLAQLDDEELRGRFEMPSLDRLTPASIGTRDELFAQLATIRRRGYAVNNGESQIGVGAVAVVVPSHPSLPRVALAVAGPSERVNSERFERLARDLHRAAEVLALRLDRSLVDGDA